MSGCSFGTDCPKSNDLPEKRAQFDTTMIEELQKTVKELQRQLHAQQKQIRELQQQIRSVQPQGHWQWVPRYPRTLNPPPPSKQQMQWQQRKGQWQWVPNFPANPPSPPTIDHAPQKPPVPMPAPPQLPSPAKPDITGPWKGTGYRGEKPGEGEGAIDTSVDWYALLEGVRSFLGVSITVSSDDPNRRIEELLENSEDLRYIQQEWERIWFTDCPQEKRKIKHHRLGIGLLMSRMYSAGTILPLKMPNRSDGLFNTHVQVVHCRSMSKGSWYHSCIFSKRLIPDEFDSLAM